MATSRFVVVVALEDSGDRQHLSKTKISVQRTTTCAEIAERCARKFAAARDGCSLVLPGTAGGPHRICSPEQTLEELGVGPNAKLLVRASQPAAGPSRAETYSVRYTSALGVQQRKTITLPGDLSAADAVLRVAKKFRVAPLPSHVLTLAGCSAPLQPSLSLREQGLFAGCELRLCEAQQQSSSSDDQCADAGQLALRNRSAKLLQLKTGSSSTLTASAASLAESRVVGINVEPLASSGLQAISLRISCEQDSRAVIGAVWEKIGRLHINTDELLSQDNYRVWLHAPHRPHEWSMIVSDDFPLRQLIDAGNESAGSKHASPSLWIRRAVVTPGFQSRDFASIARITASSLPSPRAVLSQSCAAASSSTEPPSSPYLSSSLPPPSPGVSLSGSSSSSVQPYVVVKNSRFYPLPAFLLPDPHCPCDTDYVSNHCLWLVSAAVLVYSPDDIAAQVAQSVWQMPRFRFFYDAATDTQAMAFANDELVVVAFRGTDSMQDWKINLKARAVPLVDDVAGSSSKIRVHNGFQIALQSVRADIERWLLDCSGKRENPHKPLYITGHSLGGALATLFFGSLYLSRSSVLGDGRITANGLYTFGQPRCANRHFGAALVASSGCIPQRIVFAVDPVPKVGRGSHFGQLVYFNPAGKMMRSPAFHHRSSRLKNLAHGHVGLTNHWGPNYLRCVIKGDKRLKAAVASRGSALCNVTLTVHSADLTDCTAAADGAPYCVLVLPAKSRRAQRESETAADPLLPRWDAVFHECELLLSDAVVVQVWSRRAHHSDRFLGQVTLHLDDAHSRVKNVLELSARPGVAADNDTVAGSVCLSLQVTPLTSRLDVAGPRAFVTIHSASELVLCPSSAGVRTHLRVRYGDNFVLVSPPAPRAQSPSYEFTFDIPMVNTIDSLSVEVWDVKKDASMGVAIVDFVQPFEDMARASFEMISASKLRMLESLGVVEASFCFEPYPLSPELLDCPAKLRAVRLVVHSCANLVAADLNGLSDPYVVVKHPATGFKAATPRINKTLNPSWGDDQSFVIELPPGRPTCDFLHIEVMDHDFGSTDDFLGQLDLPVMPLQADIVRENFTLCSTSVKDIVTGTICISLVRIFA